MGLVDDDQLEVLEDLGPHAVLRQQSDVEQVRVGQQHMCAGGELDAVRR